MTTLYISEYADVGRSAGHAVPSASEPFNTDQTVAITAGSLSSNTFASNTRYVRIHTDNICSIVFGVSPTATATNKRMQAGQTEYFNISEGNVGKLKVAVIINT